MAAEQNNQERSNIMCDHPELTVSSLRHKLGGSSDRLGENSHDAFADTRNDTFGLAACGSLHLPAPLEVLHGLIHDARDRPWRWTRGIKVRESRRRFSPQPNTGSLSAPCGEKVRMCSPAKPRVRRAAALGSGTIWSVSLSHTGVLLPSWVFPETLPCCLIALCVWVCVCAFSKDSRLNGWPSLVTDI